MIRPVRFGYNAETAVNNAFQQAGQGDVQAEALREFDEFVATLRAHQIDVTVIEDTPEPHTPDAIFPNNWISFHPGGTVCLYPMFAENRRQERKAFDAIKKQWPVKRIVDFTHYEKQHKFLEGTGSMILDREHKLAYACLSPRTDKGVLNDFCEQMGYTPVTFNSVDTGGKEVYHTNVMMCVADRYAVVCMESITDKQEQATLRTRLEGTGKEVIPISWQQMGRFAGNMLQVQNSAGKKFLVMSQTAHASLTEEQRRLFAKYDDIISPDLHAIETNGGGSARCMMAEVY